MQLKSPTETPIHVALLSGHAIVVGPEGREVPVMFRRDALAAGCIPAELQASDIDAETQGTTEQDKPALLIKGVKMMLAANDPANFTDAGLPNRKKLSSLVGWNVTAEELTTAWQAVEAEAKSGE